MFQLPLICKCLSCIRRQRAFGLVGLAFGQVGLLDWLGLRTGWAFGLAGRAFGLAGRTERASVAASGERCSGQHAFDDIS